MEALIKKNIIYRRYFPMEILKVVTKNIILGFAYILFTKPKMRQQLAPGVYREIDPQERINQLGRMMW